MTVKEELIDYYSNKSKHSNYQVLPKRLKAILGANDIHTNTRYEKERLEYVLSKVSVKGKTILDIGGNTGFFTFELVEAGAKSAHCYEGNKEHADFVRLAAKAVNLDDKIHVTNDYFAFDGSYEDHYDVILLFNVSHHVGDDYGDKNISIQEAHHAIIKQLNSLSSNAPTIVFQMGFNWQGDVSNSLFEHGTKAEMIEFVKNGIKGHWEIITIGLAERNEEKVEYKNLNEKNIERDDSLGEFLNRPIFILKSVKGNV
jgi:SAM-dependent methyltransferase